MLVALVAVVPAMSGAGGRLRPELSKSARQISVDALHAAEHARTVHISGMEGPPGAKVGSSSIPALQLQLNVDVRQASALKGTFGPSGELLDMIAIRSCTTSTTSLKPTRTCSWSVYTQIPSDELPSPGLPAPWFEGTGSGRPAVATGAFARPWQVLRLPRSSQRNAAQVRHRRGRWCAGDLA